MEELQTTTIEVPLQDKTISCDLKEKDHGDYIVYDVYTGENYLFTLSKQGEILFNESAGTAKHEMIDPRNLNEVADYLQKKVRSGLS